MADDGLFDEGFAESFAFHYVGEGGGEGDAGLAGCADGDREAFVVEVCLFGSLVFQSKHMGERVWWDWKFTMIYLMPMPSVPIKFSAGTLTSSSSM